MTKEEAIKYLRQLYPYGGHCWLDKQRTEAIGMAIKALQLMVNTADAVIGLQNKDGGFTHLVDVSRPLPVGNNKIAIIFEEK